MKPINADVEQVRSTVRSLLTSAAWHAAAGQGERAATLIEGAVDALSLVADPPPSRTAIYRR